jgi:hypothetical protein
MSDNEKNVSVANVIADLAMLPSSEGTRPPAGGDNPALRGSFLKMIAKVTNLRGTKKKKFQVPAIQVPAISVSKQITRTGTRVSVHCRYSGATMARPPPN